MRVDFIETEMEPVRQFRIEPNAYTYRKDKRFPGLQKVCIAILALIGARYEHETEKFEVRRAIFETKDFVELLDRQKIHIEEYYHHTPLLLLIGSGDFRRIIGGDELRGPYNIPILHEYMHNGKMMDLTVVEIPWMSGILVMPYPSEIPTVTRRDGYDRR